MDHYLFLAKSVTTAQRMQQILERSGVHSAVSRAPTGLSKQGCAYAVRVGKTQYKQARVSLKDAGIALSGIYLWIGGSYREVRDE